MTTVLGVDPCPGGWVGVELDPAADWREIEAFVRRSYRLVAPKRLAKLMA